MNKIARVVSFHPCSLAPALVSNLPATPMTDPTPVVLAFDYDGTVSNAEEGAMDRIARFIEEENKEGGASAATAAIVPAVVTYSEIESFDRGRGNPKWGRLAAQVAPGDWFYRRGNELVVADASLGQWGYGPDHEANAKLRALHELRVRYGTRPDRCILVDDSLYHAVACIQNGYAALHTPDGIRRDTVELLKSMVLYD